MKKKLIFITIWLLFVAGCYYFMLPPLNIHSRAFWTFLLSVMIVPAIILNAVYRASGTEKFEFRRFFVRGRQIKASFTTVLVVCAALVVFI